MSSLKKRARIFKFVRDVRASYWFVPSLLILLSLVLAIGSEWVDRNYDLLVLDFIARLVDLQPAGARTILSVLAQSIIGVTGVMFSMTLVAVSFASGNFGPRLIDNFMRDRGNQWSLGLLISTFVFCIAILRSVHGIDAQGSGLFIPHFSISIAMALSLMCIFVIVYFIHHIPDTINVSRISSELSQQLDAEIRRRIDKQTDKITPQLQPKGAPVFKLTAQASGYLQMCDFDDLAALAESKSWLIEVVPEIGKYLTFSAPIFAIWSDSDVSDEDIVQLNRCFTVGPERTEFQNPSFTSQQLVEMVARALSPGVNDPYTAMDCLNRLAGAVTIASIYKGGLCPRSLPRLKTKSMGFEALFDQTFPLCRQYVLPDDLTRTHTLKLLKTLADMAHPDHQKTIQDEIDLLSGPDKS